MMSRLKTVLVGILIISIFVHCGDKNSQYDSPLQGRISISVDESFEPVIREQPPPLGLRREVAGELKRNGVRWFLTADGDFATADLAEHKREWGATMVGQANGVYLYRFD